MLTGGITAAAAHLGVSGTSIDKHLARLRRAFEDDLVVFTPRDTLITPLGTEIVGLAEILFEAYDEIAALVPEAATSDGHGPDQSADPGTPRGTTALQVAM